MRWTLIFLLALICQNVFGQQFIREFILEGKKDDVYAGEFGSACYQTLKQFYSEGKLLKSDILERASYPLAELDQKDDDLEGNRKKVTKTPKGTHTFYHYTKAENLKDLFRPELNNRDQFQSEDHGASVDEIMDYTKTPKFPFFNIIGLRVNKAFFYIASEPLSSRGYGDIQLSFTFSPKTRVIDIGSYYDWSLLEEEVQREYPAVFNDCDFKKMGILAIEDSGIDIIKYSDTWYQLTNFYDMINSDVLAFPNAYENTIDRTIDRVKSRKYSAELPTYEQRKCGGPCSSSP